jgi:hypothetical protein
LKWGQSFLPPPVSKKEAPYLQSGITFAKKDAIYSASLLACCSLPPLRLKLKQTTSSVITGYMFETQV